MTEREKITSEEAWETTSARIDKALSDYKTYLETGEFPTSSTNQEKYTDFYIIHFSKNNIHFDSIGGILHQNNKKIFLTPYESKMLTALVQEPEEVHSHRELYRHIHVKASRAWVDKAYKYQIMDCTRPIISRVRKKLDLIDPELRDCIVTVRGVGYYWDGEVTN